MKFLSLWQPQVWLTHWELPADPQADPSQGQWASTLEISFSALCFSLL